MQKYKNIIIPTCVLTLIACLVAALLAFTYNATGIANLGTGISEEDLAKNAPIVLPGSTTLTKADYTPTDENLVAVYLNEDKTGMAMHIKTTGYAGKSKPIEVLVGLNKDGQIQGITIVACQETPGLGTKIENPEYLQNFVGISGTAQDVDTITSATISSVALRNGVDFALNQFEQIKGDIFQ